MRLILETQRLALREMHLGDLEFVAAMLSDNAVMQYYPKSCTREDSLAWLKRQMQRYHNQGHGLWLATDRETGEPRGQVGLVLQEVDEQFEYEIGYLIHRRFWRQGLATEAALGVRRHAFENKKLTSVISLIRPENVPAQGVARKLGMTLDRETIFRDQPHLVFKVVAKTGPSEIETARE